MTAEYILEQRIIGPRLQMRITEDRYNELVSCPVSNWH